MERVSPARWSSSLMACESRSTAGSIVSRRATPATTISPEIDSIDRHRNTDIYETSDHPALDSSAPHLERAADLGPRRPGSRPAHALTDHLSPQYRLPAGDHLWPWHEQRHAGARPRRRRQRGNHL